MGRTLLLARADARQVLELFYDRAKKDSPGAVEPHLASRNCAHRKARLCAGRRSIAEAAKRVARRSRHSSRSGPGLSHDSERARKALTKALELNPHHVRACCFRSTTPSMPRSTAPRHDAHKSARGQSADTRGRGPDNAVLRPTGRRRTKNEQFAARSRWLAAWTTNPEVDHLIGRKLSQKYRFAEGPPMQREALKFDPAFLPAKAQLARTCCGWVRKTKGWKLAEEVSAGRPVQRRRLTTWSRCARRPGEVSGR